MTYAELEAERDHWRSLCGTKSMEYARVYRWLRCGARERLAAYLVLMGKQERRITRPPSQVVIASQIGVSRESVARSLRWMREKEWVRYERWYRREVVELHQELYDFVTAKRLLP